MLGRDSLNGLFWACVNLGDGYYRNSILDVDDYVILTRQESVNPHGEIERFTKDAVVRSRVSVLLLS